MFEDFVLAKIKKENEIAEKLLDSIIIGDVVTKPSILSSSLSDFTKNYLVNESDDKITRDEIFLKIEKSNKLYFNYAIRPKWTLITIFFNSFESRPPGEIQKKLRLFPFYGYYIDALNNFVKENSQIFVTKSEIISVIEDTNAAIHQKLSEEFNNVKIKNFFLQVFKLKYEQDQNYNLESTIPYSFVRIFLEDKSFSDLERKFHLIKDISDEYEISLKDIIKILTDKYGTTSPREAAQPLPDKAEPVIKITPVKQSEKTPADINIKPVKGPEQIEIKEEKKIDIKEEKKIAIKEEKKIEMPASKPEKLKAENPPERIYSGELLNAADNDTREHQPGDFQTLEKYEVRDLFNEKQLERISVKVYDNDLLYREKSFKKLSNYKTWFEASAHLKEVFKMNKVDMVNPHVIAFVDTLNDYYKKKE